MTVVQADWLKGPAQQVCKLLTDAGFEAWFVGGCVRDALIGVPVSDFDISTNAHPEQVIELSKAAGLKVIPTGLEHGTVTVVIDNVPFEVTTFRRDVATDGRRAVVAYADTMIEDARRRDFTMNALYCDIDGVVADPLGGLPDLDARCVRFIDDADQRIKEDYLRILRFFRFYAWYGDIDAGIDAIGLAACAQNLDGLAGLSKERVSSELLKLLSAPDPAPAMAAMNASGVLLAILAGASSDVMAVLVHVEQQAGLTPDPIRRLVTVGGDRDGLRLTNAQERRIAQLTSEDGTMVVAYRHGADVALDRVAIEAASLGEEIDATLAVQIAFAAGQKLPVCAADFIDKVQGPALGKALRKAEADWIASGFTLTRADLIG